MLLQQDKEASWSHTIAAPSEALCARAGSGCKAKKETVAARTSVVARLITSLSMTQGKAD
jgi:hypothetical protein